MTFPDMIYWYNFLTQKDWGIINVILVMIFISVNLTRVWCMHNYTTFTLEENKEGNGTNSFTILPWSPFIINPPKMIFTYNKTNKVFYRLRRNLFKQNKLTLKRNTYNNFKLYTGDNCLICGEVLGFWIYQVMIFNPNAIILPYDRKSGSIRFWTVCSEQCQTLLEFQNV
jgi:hypothetical protein